MHKLKEGDSAPSFQLTDSDGRPIDLAQLKGKRTLLSFHRNVACPWCNFHVHQLVTRYPKLSAQGLSVLAVFESKVDDLKKAAALHKPPFPLVTDPSGKIYADYAIDHSIAGFLASPVKHFSQMTTSIKEGLTAKLWFDTSLTRMPADFLIDEALRLRTAFYGKDAGDHVPFESLEAMLLAPV
jgi:peroxiredoxin